jgi:hypothetical protein
MAVLNFGELIPEILIFCWAARRCFEPCAGKKIILTAVWPGRERRL